MRPACPQFRSVLIGYSWKGVVPAPEAHASPVGLVQQKTGQAREHIERVLGEISEQAGGSFTQATETAREYAHQAADRGDITLVVRACDRW